MTTYINRETGEVLDLLLRTENNYDRDQASWDSGLKCQDPSLTQQQFREDSDINTIVARFGITGVMPENFGMPSSSDFTDTVSDYHTALNLVRQADEDFLLLPANVRERFRNNPQNLMDFIENPANLQEARELKLARPEIRVVQPLEEG